MSDNKLTIAGENAVILFEGLFKSIEQSEIEKWITNIDIAFKPIEDKIDYFKEELENQEINDFEFHIIFFKTDGKSCAVKKSIENISIIHFNEIIKIFKEVGQLIRKEHFNLGLIYRMIPVQVNKKKEQLNINRVLDFYSSIIQGTTISVHTVFDYYSEALACSRRKFLAKKADNYYNLYQLGRLVNKETKGFEYFVKEISIFYLGLIKVLTKLEILDKEVLTVEKDISELELNPTIQEKENFLCLNGFSKEAKGLFYLGCMTYQIGRMQEMQNHKNKPILNKISYMGMGTKDILDLYCVLLEKFNQYQSAIRKKAIYLIIDFEKYHHMATKYLGNLPNVLGNEKENLFYLMSGYSSCIYIKKSAEEEDTNDSEQ
ncbi:CRISPR-associated protein, Csh1 family [Lachnospiraceae bacterium TWA4]|nr:CRISPR-associated protein, Csh1 family [Lachnospiraceae bacterium TWA4]